MPKPIVAIVGRPNVGKSTLFNRIVGERVAIVQDIAGVTRDRLYRETSWLERQFFLVDTGGITIEEDPIKQQIYTQAHLAIEEADVIIFVADAREGLHPLDREISDVLRKTSKPVVLTINKADHYDLALGAEFYALGLGEPTIISAEHGLNIGDLLDKVIKNFSLNSEEEKEDEIKVALIGRPNVGKSSLLNSIVGEDRVIVSPIPGTTRDAIDTVFNYSNQIYRIIDTAGIRRKSRIDESIEYYSVLRAIRAVERTNIALLVLDATHFIAEQDKKVAGIAHEAGKAIIIIVNKWDLIEKDDQTVKKFEEHIRSELSFLDYAPIMFVSAKTGKRVEKIMSTVFQVANEYARRIPTRMLNNLLQDAMAVHYPPAKKGKQLKIFYAVQIKVKPPTIQLWVNEPELLHFSYVRFLENRIRENYSFTGSPLRFVLKVKEKNKE